MTKEIHIHKLKRLRYKSGNQIFFCCLPDCKFKSSIALLLGKRSICWRCGNEFLMSDYALRLAKPHCSSCHRSKESLESNITEEVLNLNQQTGVGELSLSERLTQTLKKVNTVETQIVEEEEI